MPTIERLFEDFFEDSERSHADLDAGTNDHIQRMEGQNGDGSFAALIAKTKAVYDPFSQARSGASGTLAQQKGSTDVAGLAEEEMRQFLRDGEDQINVSFKGNSPDAIKARVRFYPNGLKPFNNAKRGEWATLLAAYGDAVTTYTAQLPPAFVADYAQRSQALLGALGEQGGLKGQLSTGYKDVALLEKAVTLQLSENARTLGIRFALEPSKGAAFFDARYFERSRNAPASISHGRQRALADFTLPTDESAPLTLSNIGPDVLLFRRAPDATAAKTPLSPDSALTLAPGETRTLKVGEVPGTGALLVVANPSPREGKFRVEG